MTEPTDAENALLQLVQNRRFLDLERVPLICKDIEEIKLMLADQKKTLVTQDQFYPVKIIAYGLVSTTMVGVITSLLILLLRK